MQSISRYIIEKLKINKEVAQVEKSNLRIDISRAKDRNAMFTDSEIEDILIEAGKLPVIPAQIEMTKTGGIILDYRKKNQWPGGVEYYTITIKKPSGYNGSWKIEFNYDVTMNYAFPSGASISLDKNGKPVLPDAKEAFKKILYVWNKRDFGSRIK